MRQASITTSWVAEANATSTAKAATTPRWAAGSEPETSHRPKMMTACAISIHARRCPRSGAAGNRGAIDQWRPQELERVGKGREAEETDRAQRHVHLPQPGRERVEDQQVGQSRREAEGEHDQHAPLEEDGERRSARCDPGARLPASCRRARTAPIPPTCADARRATVPLRGCGMRLRRDPARSLLQVPRSAARTCDLRRTAPGPR